MRGFLAGMLVGAMYGLGLAAVAAPPQPAAETELAAGPAAAPAYMLVLGEVFDRPAFGAGYAAKLPPLYEQYGGEYVAVGRGVEVLEGDYAPQSYVVGRWPSLEAARAFWSSPEYDVLRRARIDNQWGNFDVLLVEGLPEAAREAPLAREAARP